VGELGLRRRAADPRLAEAASGGRDLEFVRIESEPVLDRQPVLPHCLLHDWVRLGSRLVRLLRDRHHPDKHEALLRRILDEVRASIALRETRRLNVPRVSYPPDLPISARKDEIVAAIRHHQVVVIAGETGSGKTTQIPKMCLEAGLGIEAMIGCTQPRRVAALSISRRIAEELNVTWGREVGCKPLTLGARGTAAAGIAAVGVQRDQVPATDVIAVVALAGGSSAGAVVGEVTRAHDMDRHVAFGGIVEDALRGGHHCNQPLMKKLGVPSTARASFYIYNTQQEIDRFVQVTAEIQKFFAA